MQSILGESNENRKLLKVNTKLFGGTQKKLLKKNAQFCERMQKVFGGKEKYSGNAKA